MSSSIKDELNMTLSAALAKPYWEKFIGKVLEDIFGELLFLLDHADKKIFNDLNFFKQLLRSL